MEPTFKKGFWETGKVFKEQPQNEHQLISDKKYKYETPKNWTYCIGWKKERGLMLYNYVTGRVKLDKDGCMILNTRTTRGLHKKLKVK